MGNGGSTPLNVMKNLMDDQEEQRREDQRKQQERYENDLKERRQELKAIQDEQRKREDRMEKERREEAKALQKANQANQDRMWEQQRLQMEAMQQEKKDQIEMIQNQQKAQMELFQRQSEENERRNRALQEEQQRKYEQQAKENAERVQMMFDNMKESSKDQMVWFQNQQKENQKMMVELITNMENNRVTDEEYREKVAEFEREQKRLQEEALQKIAECDLANEEKELLQEIVNNDIREAYKRQFPMSPELAEMKKRHPDAVFIQVLGSSGTGKSTLMNTIVSGTDEVDEEGYVEIFKSDDKECTLETQFHDVTAEFKRKFENNQFSWIKKEKGGNFPKVFLVDQPGIGGQKISAQGYMAKFAPGHYDFTIAATASRLMENEYFLMMHLQKYEKPYIIVRTKVDADVSAAISGKRHTDDNAVREKIENLKKNFLETDIQDLNKKSVHFTGKPIRVPKTGNLIDFNDEYLAVMRALSQGVCDAINKVE